MKISFKNEQEQAAELSSKEAASPFKVEFKKPLSMGSGALFLPGNIKARYVEVPAILERSETILPLSTVKELEARRLEREGVPRPITFEVKGSISFHMGEEARSKFAEIIKKYRER